MVARYVVPEINGYLAKLRKSQKFVIENRAVFERAGEAVMAKIMENEGRRRAAAHRPGPGRDPDHQRAGPAEGSRQAQGVMACTWSDEVCQRHCERSEAIDSATADAWIARRYASRNDG